MRNKRTGSKDFRELLDEIAMLMGYELTRDLPLENIEIETPLVKMTARRIAGKQASFNFMAAVTICNDFGAQKYKVCHCFHCFPIYLP